MAKITKITKKYNKKDHWNRNIVLEETYLDIKASNLVKYLENYIEITKNEATIEMKKIKSKKVSDTLEYKHATEVIKLRLELQKQFDKSGYDKVDKCEYSCPEDRESIITELPKKFNIHYFGETYFACNNCDEKIKGCTALDKFTSEIGE